MSARIRTSSFTETAQIKVQTSTVTTSLYGEQLDLRSRSISTTILYSPRTKRFETQLVMTCLLLVHQADRELSLSQGTTRTTMWSRIMRFCCGHGMKLKTRRGAPRGLICLQLHLMVLICTLRSTRTRLTRRRTSLEAQFS